MADHYTHPPAGLPAGSRVWAYFRDSGGPSQEQSVEQQEREIVAYCKSYDLVLVQTFRDVARSGGSTIGRDGFLSMMDMSDDETSRPAGLLIWNFARFARDYNDSVYYKATLNKRGIIIHSLTDQIPDDVFAGRIVETVITLANEEKRRQTSRDVKRGLKSLVSKGYSPGIPPRGYIGVKVNIGEKRDHTPRIVSKWVPDPVLAEYVKKAFQLRAEGKSYQEITKATNCKLYSSNNSWASFFRNRAYLGLGICDDLEVPDHHEPLITFEVFDAVERLRVAHPLYGIKGHLHHPRRVGNPTILSGFTYCIECGMMMTHSTGNKKHYWPNYLCGAKDRRSPAACSSRRVGAKRAETQILSVVLDHVLTPEYLMEVIEETKKQFASTDELELQIEATEHTLVDLDIAIQRLLNTIERTRSQAAQDRLREREVDKAHARAEIETLKLKLANAKVEITPEAMTIILQAWRDQLSKAQETGNVREIKAWLMQFVSRIELGYNRARIFYTYPSMDFSSPRNAVFLRGGTK